MHARYPPDMRTTEDLHQGTRTGRQAQTRRVGAYLSAAATAAGYDIRRRRGGRAQLAALTGLSLTTISRTLDGRTLPLPSQLAKWATVLNLDHRAMLVDSGLIPEQRGPRTASREAASAALSPNEAMNAWGISDPIIRKTLNASIVHAIRLQEELDAADGWEAVALR
ncbi:helix-turn-helix domain-containing protein [Streptomyces sp. NPDC087437]|uniref:helix-turn-helix domain-containing protein n=1 Tax=Streptomyces sp. NPDC087437 TaxID=3365789 RepID=UPI0038232390